MENVHLLVSDLDGTLLGDEEGLARFTEWFAERRAGWRLAYSSGRFFGPVCESVRSTALPPPDVIIGGVGTEIRHYPEGTEMADGWPRRVTHWDLEIIRRELSAFPELELQPDEFQAQFKLSYYGHDLPRTRLATFEQRLRVAGQRVHLVYSSLRDLDVLPLGVDKGAAAAALASVWNLEPLQVLVAGDSGNDASMFARGFRGIVVANAQPELRRIEDAGVYHAQRSFAAGVQEGLEHWLAEAG